MAKENAYLLFQGKTLEEIEKSNLVMFLVLGPDVIADLEDQIDTMELCRKKPQLELEALQKGYDDLFKLTFTQRLFKGKKIQEEKSDYEAKIFDTRRIIFMYENAITDNKRVIAEIKRKNQELCKTLEGLGLTSEDVVDAYKEVKQKLQLEIEAKRLAEKKAQMEALKLPEPDDVRVILRKKDERLSAKEKFERRLAKTREIKEMQNQQLLS